MKKEYSSYRICLYPDFVFGKGKTAEVGKLVKEHGGTKVLIVGYGADLLPELYGIVRKALEEEGIAYVEIPGVVANPRRSLVNKAVELAKSENIDFIVALGGGSVIDSAKAIAYAKNYDGEWWDFYTRKASPKKEDRVPVGAINTISASGSETSKASVILDDIDTMKKIGVATEFGRPVFAIEDPVNTYSVPAFQTGCGSVDILAHTFDCYFTPRFCALGDEFDEGLMRNTVRYAPIAYNDPTNYEARAELMLTCSFCHNDIATLGRERHGGGTAGAHDLEFISEVYDKPHGAGLAIIMPHILEWYVEGSADTCAKVARFANQVFGVPVDFDDMKITAYEGIRRFRNWLKSMGMPSTLSELGITDPDAPQKLCDAVHYEKDGTYSCFYPMTKADVLNFFKELV